MEREPIYAALFTLVAQAPGLVTTSRALRHWTDCELSEMPVLFQAQAVQAAMVRTNQLTRWELQARLWIYVDTTNAGPDGPGPVLNPIMDAIENMFANGPVGHQRLGGLVEYARIDGLVETTEGRLGSIEVATVPIKMLVVS